MHNFEDVAEGRIKIEHLSTKEVINVFLESTKLQINGVRLVLDSKKIPINPLPDINTFMEAYVLYVNMLHAPDSPLKKNHMDAVFSLHVSIARRMMAEAGTEGWMMRDGDEITKVMNFIGYEIYHAMGGNTDGLKV